MSTVNNHSDAGHSDVSCCCQANQATPIRARSVRQRQLRECLTTRALVIHVDEHEAIREQRNMSWPLMSQTRLDLVASMDLSECARAPATVTVLSFIGGHRPVLDHNTNV